MLTIELIVHVTRETGVQNDVSAVDTATLEIEQQFPGKRSASRRHFGRAGFGRVNGLVIIEIPRRRDVFVADWLPQPVDKIDKFGAGNREANFPETRDVRIALQHSRGQSFGEFNLHARAQTAPERIALLANQKREP